MVWLPPSCVVSALTRSAPRTVPLRDEGDSFATLQGERSGGSCTAAQPTATP